MVFHRLFTSVRCAKTALQTMKVTAKAKVELHVAGRMELHGLVDVVGEQAEITYTS